MLTPGELGAANRLENLRLGYVRHPSEAQAETTSRGSEPSSRRRPAASPVETVTKTPPIWQAELLDGDAETDR